MRDPDPTLYLLHIRDACEHLTDCLALRDAGETPSWLLFAAVARFVEVIGEASRKIGEEFREAHPQVPWRQMNAMRNVMIHEYHSVSEPRVWQTIAEDIPALHKAVLAILAELPERP